jgi:hypothetical protein
MYTKAGRGEWGEWKGGEWSGRVGEWESGRVGEGGEMFAGTCTVRTSELISMNEQSFRGVHLATTCEREQQPAQSTTRNACVSKRSATQCSSMHREKRVE